MTSYCTEEQSAHVVASAEMPEITGADVPLLISVEARPQDSLDWTEPLRQAEEAVENGCKIIWDLDLGLFGGLSAPLTDETQFQALALGIEHFVKTLWTPFAEHSVGVNLGRCTSDFTHNFCWTSELDERIKSKGEVDSPLAKNLFCRDLLIDFLGLLIVYLPIEAVPHLVVDVEQVTHWGEIAQLLSPESWEHINLSVEGAPSWVPQNFVSCNEHVGVILLEENETENALLDSLDSVLRSLYQREISFRVISESFITSEWHGLNHLIVISAGVSSEGRRKLAGFCAADGMIVTLGEGLGLPLESRWDEFQILEPVATLNPA